MTLQPLSQAYEWTFRRVVWATLILAFVAFGFWLLYRFNQVVFILFISIIMGTVIRPVVTWLNLHGIPRLAGVILVYLLLLVLFIGFVLLLFPMIIEQGTTISTALPGYYQGFREWMTNNPNQLILRLGGFLPWTYTGAQPVQQTGEQVLASAAQVIGYGALAVKIIFVAIIVLLLTFHWTLEGPRTIQSLLMLIPTGKRENISELISAMETKVGAFIAGEGVLCLAIGTMALIAYLLIGLPNALLLALLAGILEAVPMVGPLLGAIPAAAIALSIAPSKLVWVIVSTIVIQQFENSLLVPRVMRKAVGVNPFVSLLAIFAFSSFFGIAGALMAIPMAAIIQLLLDRFIFNPSESELDVSDGRDLASRLRYEAQDLVQDLRKQARFKKRGSVLKIKQIDKMMDEIEGITTDLDALLAQVPTPGTP
jgi:predicted PurR-regulated permease PerM